MIRIGSPEQFRVVRDFLRRRFSEEIVSASLGVGKVGDFDKRPDGTPIRDPLVRLLFGGAAVPFRELRESLPASAGEPMSELGLLEAKGDRIFCPVILYPFHGLHFISDRFTQPDGSPLTGDREFVYFALTTNTQNYIESLPQVPCKAFLDVGAGNGAAALIQARHAATSVATDISTRSVLFAEFNRRLNGIEHAEVVEGSLYDPVRGRTFDRIGCHPPYDVSGSTPWTFADGGVDGEFVIRGVVAGLLEFLAPGGEFISQFRAADQRSKPLQDRVREWIGAAHPGFDIALVVRSTVSVEEYAVGSVLSTDGTREQYREFVARYEQLEVEQLVYCSLLIRRRTSGDAPLTVRKTMGQRCTWDELSWLLDGGVKAGTTDLSTLVLSPSSDMEIVVRHKAVEGALRPVEYALTTISPFQERLVCPEWMALLVSQFDGKKTSADVFAAINGQVSLEPAQFDAALKQLLSAGMLRTASGSAAR